MSISLEKQILIVGIGNMLRSDDGVGAYVCEKIEQLKLPGTTTIIVQQLHVEMIEEMTYYDHVILVDAAATSDILQFEPLQENPQQTLSSSHHINASFIQTLSQKLYNKTLSIYLCAIPGSNFDTGDTLSTQTEKIAMEATILIKNWINKL
jgi:hydrogenase maturation protease